MPAPVPVRRVAATLLVAAVLLVARTTLGGDDGPAAPQDVAADLALVGGRVHPVSGPAVEKGTVLVYEGRIVAVGTGLVVPSGARVIDCSGKVVTPGLVDADTVLGLSSADRDDRRLAADAVAADGVHGRDPGLATALGEGVTSLVVSGGVNSVVGGRASVVSTAAPEATGGAPAPLREGPVVLNLSVPGRAGGIEGGGRLASVQALLLGAATRRQQIERWRRDLAEYEDKRLGAELTDVERLLLPPEVLDEMLRWSPAQRAAWREAVAKSTGRKYEKPKNPATPPKDPRQDPAGDIVMDLLGGDGRPGARCLVRAELGADVRAVLALTAEHGLAPTVCGGAGLLEEARALAARRIPVVVTRLGDMSPPGTGPRSRREPGLVAGLVAAGLRPALGSGGTGGRFLRLLAAREIGEGLSREDALRSVTLWAAEAAGVDDRIGSLRPGRRADVVVWSGDPFSVASRAEVVIVAGKVTRDE